MKYFGHETNASMNAKLKMVKAKYGYEGWGLYWHVLEIIACELDPPRKQSCVYEGNALILADRFTSEERVTEILEYFVELNLFSKDAQGRYVNIKLLERLDETTKRKTRTNYNPKRTRNPVDNKQDDGTIRNNPEQSGQSKVKESKLNETKEKPQTAGVLINTKDKIIAFKSWYGEIYKQNLKADYVESRWDDKEVNNLLNNMSFEVLKQKTALTFDFKPRGYTNLSTLGSAINLLTDMSGATKTDHFKSHSQLKNRSETKDNVKVDLTHLTGSEV